MEKTHHCVKCGNLSMVNDYGVCKECENYDQNKNNIKIQNYDYQKK